MKQILSPRRSSSTSTRRRKGGALRPVSSLAVHPSYRPGHPSGQHDLALLKVELEAEDETHFACLPSVGDDPAGGCSLASHREEGPVEEQVFLVCKIVFGLWQMLS